MTATTPDFGGQITSAVNQGKAVMTDNVVALLAIPVLWVGYRVARKIVGKIG